MRLLLLLRLLQRMALGGAHWNAVLGSSLDGSLDAHHAQLQAPLKPPLVALQRNASVNDDLPLGPASHCVRVPLAFSLHTTEHTRASRLSLSRLSLVSRSPLAVWVCRPQMGMPYGVCGMECVCRCGLSVGCFASCSTVCLSFPCRFPKSQLTDPGSSR